MGASMRFLLAAALLATATGVRARSTTGLHVGANPVRKVVTLLQNMHKKVEAEGEKEKALFDKFMCYCKTGAADLEKSIAASKATLSDQPSKIKAAEEEKTQTEADLKAAQEDRTEAKSAMATATALREKEAKAYAAEAADTEANIQAITSAVAALEKGVAGSFLQTGTAKMLQKLVLKQEDMEDGDRQALMSFLSGTEDAEYAPSSGEVIGILKQMGDEMAKSLAEAQAAETAAIKDYEALIAAKTKEVETLTAAIETKTARIGELGVTIVQMQNDLDGAEATLAEDQKFLAEMDKSCKSKAEEWAEIVKVRAEELVAITETIKILNDDDALELFKKTLPSASASFLQVQVGTSEMRSRALAVLRDARNKRANRADRTRIDAILLSLQGKSVGFEKIIAMVDEQIKIIKEEQAADDHQKEYCATQFDEAEDKKKALERSISDEDTAIATMEDGIATLKEEIKGLEDGIKKLDKSVTEATEQRKEENEDFTELMASDTAAKELLGVAKNRLNKFYNPKLYKPPPKRVLSAEDEIVVSMGGTMAPTMPPGGIAGTGISFMQLASARGQAAPPPPPEAFGAYSKKSEESTGVISMIDMMIKDLDKEMQVSEVEEKDAQADYEEMIADSKEKRAADSKSLTEKESAKASMEEDLESHKASKTSASEELLATEEFIHSLHSECDWLLKYFDVRKEARISEIDALSKAKAVLSGADYSLLQLASHRFLQQK